MSRARDRAIPTPARRIAYRVLRRTFEQGEFTDRAFREEAEGVAGRERAQAQRVSYGSVQRRGSLDAVTANLARRRPQDLEAPILAALRLGLYELLYSEAAPHAVVYESVELARAAGTGRGGRGLINAILRRADRERDAILDRLARDDTPERAAIAHSVPGWIAEHFWEQFGKEGALSILETANEPAERALRVNTQKWSAEEAAARLRADSVRVTTAEPVGSIELAEMLAVDGRWGDIAGPIAEGLLVPQSRGSAASVALLDPRPGESVLELCAGPGTKTGQIAARMGGTGEVVAVEIEADRAAEVEDQVRRQGLSDRVEVVKGDAAKLELAGRTFDRVLVDPPCSDLGTLSSRPDVRWRKSRVAVERLAALQAAILDRALAHLSPGGVLVYSTCTLSARENEHLVAEVAAASPRFKVEDLGARYRGLASGIDDRFIQIRPDRDRTTGFFIARGVYCAAAEQ